MKIYKAEQTMLSLHDYTVLGKKQESTALITQDKFVANHLLLPYMCEEKVSFTP